MRVMAVTGLPALSVAPLVAKDWPAGRFGRSDCAVESDGGAVEIVPSDAEGVTLETACLRGADALPAGASAGRGLRGHGIGSRMRPAARVRSGGALGAE